MALNKYDTLADSRMDTDGTKVSLQLILDPLKDGAPKNTKEANPNFSGNPNETLATSASITMHTGNPTTRKWKQLARLPTLMTHPCKFLVLGREQVMNVVYNKLGAHARKSRFLRKP